MTNHAEAIPTAPLSLTGPGDGQPTRIRVLIEIPKVVETSRPTGYRSSDGSRLRFESTAVRHDRQTRRPRRRLRKEVRLVGWAVLIMLPTLFTASRFWSSHLGNLAVASLTHAPAQADSNSRSNFGAAISRQVSRSVFEPAVVLLSVEPATQAPANSEPTVPVKLPGYLLPEDTYEDADHEGS